MTRTADPDRLRVCIGRLNDELDGSDNFIKTFPHTDRHGLVGYDVYFGGDYVFGRTVDTIRACGLEIVSISRAIGKSDHVEHATLEVRVTERNTDIRGLLEANR